jgi:Nickel responsive protein SCO4226-like
MVGLIERVQRHQTSSQLDRLICSPGCERGQRLLSRRVRAERFPEIEWEHSHVVRTKAGLTSYCVYTAPSAQHIRDHAAAVGLPADEVQEIELDLLP